MGEKNRKLKIVLNILALQFAVLLRVVPRKTVCSSFSDIFDVLCICLLPQLVVRNITPFGSHLT